MENDERKKTMGEYMPVDAWIAARTLPVGRATSTTLWRDWAAFVGHKQDGPAFGWGAKSLAKQLRARGYECKKSGERWVIGISLRPAGELAPSAPAGEGAPVVRGAQDVL